MSHPAPLKEANPATWANWLGPLLGHESIGRATLVGDQIRASMAQWKRTGQSPLVGLCDESGHVGMLHTRRKENSDSVTVLCGGNLNPDVGPAASQLDSISADEIPSPMVDSTPRFTAFTESLRHGWAEADVRIAYWSTGTEQDPASTAAIPRRFGFTHLADLSYQTLQIAREDPISGTSADEPETIRLGPETTRTEPETTHSIIRLEPIDPSEYDVLEEMVEQTYVDSADCPAINQYRSAAETLAGYRDAPAHAPDHWFWCVESVVCPSLSNDPATLSTHAQDRVVGCVILGLHGRDSAGQRPVVKPGHLGEASQLVVEIVYMALLPDHRGRGLGRSMVTAVVDQYRRSARSIILAVDGANTVAADLYGKAGFQEVFRERVWFWHESMR